MTLQLDGTMVSPMTDLLTFEYNDVTVRWRNPNNPELLTDDFFKALGKPIPIELSEPWIDITQAKSFAMDDEELRDRLEEEFPPFAADLDASY